MAGSSTLRFLCLSGVLAAGCASSGAQDFQIAQGLQARGELEAAHQAYVKAEAADPNNADFTAARRAAGRKLAEGYAETAEVQESEGNYSGAGQSWTRAAELDRDTPSYAVRAALSNAKSEELGVTEWYEAVAVVAEEHPKSPIAQRTLKKAKDEAYAYHVALGREALARRKGSEALAHFESAQAVDPSTPGLSRDDYDEAEARAMAEKAEGLAAAGDAVGAYETYRAAYAKRPLPDIQRAMKGVKARAAAVLAQLEKARNLAERRRFAQALTIYDRLLKAGNTPDSVADEAAAVREDLVRQESQTAARAADRGDLRRALRGLQGVLPHADLGASGRAEMEAALALIKEGDPAGGLEAAGKVGLPETSPLLSAVRSSAVAEARRQVGTARRLSRRNKAKALTSLAKLSAFEADLPEIEGLRRSLRSDALEDLLDEALKAARRGDDIEVAAAMQAALQAAEPSDALRAPVQSGLDAFKAGRYADAERSFREGLAAVPRSRIAQEGARAAQIRRATAEREALTALKRRSPRSGQAVEILAASFELSAASGAAREGRALLEARLDEKLSDAEAASTLGWLVRLSEMDEATRTKIEEGADLVEAGRFDAAESAFAAAGAHPVALRGQALAKARVTATLESSAKDASDTEAGADAIARLFERDPKDPAAQQALNALIERAETSAARGNDREAARLLGLAARARGAEGDLKAALDEGHAALAAGDTGKAAQAYGRARALAPADPVAARGAKLAEKLDAEVLARAVSEGSLTSATAALSRTIERNPDSPEAQAAITKLLDQGEAAINEGRYAEGAQVLEAANVASAPAVREQVSQANQLLGQGKLDEAVQAYAKALAGGRSDAAERGRSAAQRARMSQLVSSAKVLAAMKDGSDLPRSALAVRTLLRADPTQAEGRAAVRAVLDHAEAAADRGDADTVMRDLGLAADALGQTSVTRRALQMIRTGKLEEAEGAFTQNAGELAKRGPDIVGLLRVRKLKSGLGEGGMGAATAIRALLRKNPNDATAKEAFAKILGRLASAAKSGDAASAAAALREANAASGADLRISEVVTAAAEPLAAGRAADAEAKLEGAKSSLPPSDVVDAGLAAALELRTQGEKTALEGLRTGEDPRTHADRLLASRVLSSGSPALARGLKVALARAESAQKAGEVTLLSRSLAAAGRLEASTSEGTVAMNEAADLIAKNQLAEAETAYEALRGTVATRGRSLVRALRVDLARAAVDTAAKAGRLLEEAEANRALLALAPKDRGALARDKRLAREVRVSRVAAAEKQFELGRAGVAWLYLDRALRLDPTDRKATALKANVEAALEQRKDLILVVEAIRKEGASDGSCKRLEPALQSTLMTELSKRTDLNSYVLSESWTKAWRNKDPRAPVVGGGVQVVIKSCTAGSGAGKLVYDWAVQTPKSGKPTASGTVSVEVAAGSLLKDEQDGAGENVRRILVTRAVDGLVDAFKAKSASMRQWLLTTTEHELSAKNPEAAADAFARFRMRPVKSADPDRVDALRVALDKAFP